MELISRYIEKHITSDLNEKIVLLSGPKQVGKTTLSKQLNYKFDYYNFDSTSDRKIISDEEWDRDTDLLIFDELHKMKKWKTSPGRKCYGMFID